MVTLIERYTTPILIGLVVILVSYGTGYYRGSSHASAVCHAQQAEVEAERQEALTTARKQARESDARAVEEKQRADALANKLWRKNRDEAASLPDRSCGFSHDEWLLLDRQLRGE